MNNSSRFSNRKEGDALSFTSAHVCEKCNGKKYIMVATRKVNHMATVYERQDCPQCVTELQHEKPEKPDRPSHERRKMASGTGYLRNKKRRRKDDE